MSWLPRPLRAGALVEVVAVLDPNEKHIFDGMVTRLGAEDPGFVRRIDRIGQPRRRFRAALAVLLWTIAPACIVIGGWTGLILAVIAVAYGARLFSTRVWKNRRVPWWSSADRRPGAASL